MKKYHINYANGRYLKAQEFCSLSAKNAGFDDVTSYGFDDIDKDFREKNKLILESPRGAGYWIWKSYFIHKKLSEINYGDLLVYSDSGSYYQNSVKPLIDIISNDPKGVISFEFKGFLEKRFTKKDTFVLMGMDEPKYTDTWHREATYIWLIKNDLTMKLANEYLEHSQNINIISDLPNITGENYGEFEDHRHDQSIWSLLCKKYEISTHKLISQHGVGLNNDYPNDNYTPITMHHRNPM